jgi:hypothetical protein
VSTLPLGIFWGLRRLADDGGRFMLLDLRGADAALLADLLTGLAPFCTGVVLEPAPGRAVWRRCATPLIGRIEAVADAAELAAAKRTGADAVLTATDLAAAAGELEIARLGEDAGADLSLRPRDAGPCLVGTRGETAALAAAPSAAGYLLAAALWRDALADAATAAARRRLIADELAPRVQALNALTADLPRAAWLDG